MLHSNIPQEVEELIRERFPDAEGVKVSLAFADVEVRGDESDCELYASLGGEKTGYLIEDQGTCYFVFLVGTLWDYALVE